MDILYKATATASGGREGSVRSDDGIIDEKLALPKSMGGPGGAATNPEQLFAAGYAACFESAVRFAARQQGVTVREASVTAEVGIGREGESFGLDVDLSVSLPGIDRATAEQLVEAAHRLCPYSKATRGNIQVRPRLAS